MTSGFFSKVKEGKGWGPAGSGPPPTDDLTTVTRDSMFLAQLVRADPTALDEETLITARICGTARFPPKYHHIKLPQSGVLHHE